MKKTFIEIKDINTNETETRVVRGDVSVLMGINEIRIIRHDDDQKTDVIDTTGKVVIVKNWGN